MGARDITKVLLIDNSVEETGAYNSIRCFIKKLKPRIKYYYAVPDGCWTRNDHLSKSGLTTYRFLELSKSWWLIWYLPQLAINTFKIRQRVKRESIGIIHVNDLYNMVGICIKLLDPSIKLIYHIRLRRNSYAQPVFGLWIWLINKISDVMIAVSEIVEKDISIQSHKLVRIYDAVDESLVRLTPNKSIDNNQVVFLYVGNYIPGKGQDHALRAFKIARGSTDKINLQFMGATGGNAKNKKYLQSLKQYAIENDLNDSITFNDPKIGKSALMAACDVVLNFSESESFSLVTLEALACGKPVIATKCGGPQEIIRHSENGILVENKDVRSMAQAIIQLALEPKTITDLSNKARVDFEKKFNPDLLADKLFDVYNRDPYN